MSKNEELKMVPDYLFEVSWEVCNKVGGIHTVIATKVLTLSRELGDRYILIGPDVHREDVNLEFEEDPELLKDWKQSLLANDNIRVKIGRWKVKGNPITVLVDFSQFISSKDDILKYLWESYRVDSISGQWDYIEPVLFGTAAGKVIESYVNYFCSAANRIVAHFHEWMTASGGLYLLNHSPYVATVFTTHATVMGRCIAGNGLPLYSDMTRLNADEQARRFNVVAKHSLEKIAAGNMDCFATVSNLTARECRYLLGKEVDIVTPNGFEDDFVWEQPEFDQKRAEARQMMIKVAEACLGIHYDTEPMIVGTSGRYEFKNKGLDIFIDSLLALSQSSDIKRPVLAYLTVPAGNKGPRKDLQAHLADPNNPIDPNVLRNTTHYLENPDWDPIINRIKNTRLVDPSSPVQVIFVPSYLNQTDGIFNKSYYELLCGVDVTVFPSYYEPWGYTPLESIAFSVPTITTTLTGFGLWVDSKLKKHEGVAVISRNDTNDAEVVAHISEVLQKYLTMPAEEYANYRSSAHDISKIALWENLIEYYYEAYRKAHDRAISRNNRAAYEGAHNETTSFVKPQPTNSPSWTRIMVKRQLPEQLHPLEELSKNLWWCWTLEAYELFEYIDRELWVKCEKNPIDFLDRLTHSRILALEKDELFLGKLDAVYTRFKNYMKEKKHASGPSIAYFSMEYGLHSSLKIYSGGLGILAGDYLKEASDKNVPMVAVGLLYRYGYFTQKLSNSGAQEASYEAQNFSKLPISPVLDDNGNWMDIQVALPGRIVTARIWRCDVGRTELYLLDTDHELNQDEDRSITYHLYGGDWENRLKQEMLLGIGGIRALKALNIRQDIYHCNEGHAAFIGIERIRNLIHNYKLSFDDAIEVVRSSSLFTTHTPVPAGHDAFPESMIRQYMSHYPDRLGITWEQFISLGRACPGDSNEKFSMSFLACNLSQEVNGVSWLHGEVSKDIFKNMWPGYFKDELHIGYVTNGVHFPTWCAANLRRLYAKYFSEGFTQKEYDIEAWQKVRQISNRELWDARLVLKNKLVNHIKQRVSDPKQFRFDSPRQMIRIKESLNPDVLTIGFARRFATYKRANLLFTNLDRLDKIVNNPQCPVQFIFAGKAHPNDKPGQDLIKHVVEVAAMPQFVGKIIFLQNYDMELARRMVQGVDVWLNTPTRPLEASGTSGEKAVMNGVMHFSVLDGWWVEGYKEGGGWMLPMERTFEDQNFQNEMDAEMIYNTIEEQIVPKYYKRDEENIPNEWVESIKTCIADIASHFTTNRMLNDYQEQFYTKLHERNLKLRADDFKLTHEIVAWKRRVSEHWDKVHVVNVKQADTGKGSILMGHSYNVEVTVDIDGLSPEDIGVEMILSDQITEGNVHVIAKVELKYIRKENSIAYFSGKTTPEATGSFDMAIRVFPKNSNLPHRMDFALVKWA